MVKQKRLGVRPYESKDKEQVEHLRRKYFERMERNEQIRPFGAPLAWLVAHDDGLVLGVLSYILSIADGTIVCYDYYAEESRQGRRALAVLRSHIEDLADFLSLTLVVMVDPANARMDEATDKRGYVVFAKMKQRAPRGGPQCLPQ